MVSVCGASLAGLVLLLGAVVGISTVTAQELPYFTDTVDVDLVNIEVVVTDRKGEPVTGLTREDFVLLVDGEPVELTNFFAVTERRPVVSASGIAAEAEPAGPEVGAALPESQQLNLVVFIDDANLQPGGRKAAFAALREFLKLRAGSGQRFMLVRYADSLEVLTEMTDNHEEILSGIDEIESAIPPGIQRFSEWARIVRQIELSANPKHDGDIRTYALSVRHACRVEIARIKRLIDTLSGLKGRKAILFVSDGMPIQPGQSLLALGGDGGSAVLAAGRYSIRRDLKSLSDYANANRITFHTLNSGGWSGYELQAKMAVLVATPIVDQGVTSTADWNHSVSLAGMAIDTGGQALRKANLTTLLQLATDLDSYYSLGFSPRDEEKLSSHRIKVKVNRRGLKLRYRNGFRAISREQRLANEAVAALIGESDENRLQLSLDIGDSAKRYKGRSFLVPMTVRIPSEMLAFVQDGDSWYASVVIHVTAQDERGDLADPVKESLPISIPEHVYSSGEVPDILYDLELRVRKGALKVALSVHDELGGLTTALVSHIKVSDEGVVTIVDSSEPDSGRPV
jgi:VWFA-related protein